MRKQKAQQKESKKHVDENLHERTDKPFLDRLEEADNTSGLIYLLPSYLTEKESVEAFHLLNNKENLPWNPAVISFGELLKDQHGYEFNRSKKEMDKYEGLKWLDDMCRRIEKEFDGSVSNVWCNRFVDPTHRIDWHSDHYGEHILVLTLGSTRTIQFRHNWTRKVQSFHPQSGDLYLMPLGVNKTYQHRVCSLRESASTATSMNGQQLESQPNHPASMPTATTTRMSFVFYLKTPDYAPKQFKIGRFDKIRGAFESWLDSNA